MARIQDAQNEQTNTKNNDLESVIALRAHYRSKDGTQEMVYTYRCKDYEARTDRGARYMAEYLYDAIRPAIKPVIDRPKLILVEISTHELLVNQNGKVKKEYFIDAYNVNDSYNKTIRRDA